MKPSAKNTSLTPVALRLPLGMVKSLVLMAAQAGLDAAVYWACLGLTSYFRGMGTPDLGFERKIFFSGVILICFFFNSLYQFKSWVFWDEMREVLKSLITAIMMIVVYVFAMKLQLPRMLVFMSAALFAPACLLGRYLFRRAAAAARLLNTPVLIIGAGKAGELYAKKVAEHPFMSCEVVGFLDDDPSKADSHVAGVPVLGGLNDFVTVQREVCAEEVVVAISTASRKLMANILLKIVKSGVRQVSYIPDMYMLTTFSASIRDIGGLHMISASHGLLNPFNRMVKSVMDYVGAVLALALFSPVFLCAAWKIKRDDGGSVLFRHNRVGHNLEPFKLHKFRTMVPNAEAILKEMLKDEEKRLEFETAFKFKDDPRITKVGKFLRKTSLDEMPQIFNVLMGEMSLIGPRPIVKKEVELYYGEKTARQIFYVKPGMTGLWQVSGRNDVDDYQTRIDLDLYYIHNWSLWLDIVILFRTVKVLINGYGAY
jgi:undecaprenyl-phosphate galactose phosphotransferase